MKLKRLNIIGVALLLTLFAFFTSCETWIDTEINEDPNNPVEVSMDLILPSIIVNMAYDQGGNDAVRTLGIWTQQFDGVDRQSYTEATFTYTPADCNNLWNGVYPNMIDIKDVIEKASEITESGAMYSPHTKGMAEVLLAEHLAFVTNLWGDVPYSEALSGDENLNPKLDSQQSIYAEIHALLDQALIDLQDVTGLVGIPSSDLFFGGDEDAWLATAYALKARYSLILSKVNGNSAYTDAITYANMALTAGFDGFVADIFIDSPSGANPIYQFMDQRSGDLVMCATFMDYLYNNADMRIYAVGDGENLAGSIPTTQTTEGVDLPGDYVAAIDAPVKFMTLSELYFIKAEAEFMTSAATAEATFQMGIEQSVIEMSAAGEYDPEDIYDDGTTTAADFAAGFTLNTIEDIITEKWVATFGTVQAFNDWRRTGYPTLTIPVNATNSSFPRRFPYSQEEVTYNSNVTGDASIFDRVWWDTL